MQSVPQTEEQKFVTTSPMNQGLDILFNSVDRMKAFSRCASGRAEQIPDINNFLVETQQNTDDNNIEDMIDDATVNEITIIANRTTFNYLNCVWHEIQVNPNYLMGKALQSRNKSYSRVQVCSLGDLNAIKESILQLTQT